MPIQAEGQVRPEKSAYHSVALSPIFPEKDISLLLPRACSTMDKIVDCYALTIYPYSISLSFLATLCPYLGRLFSHKSFNSLHQGRFVIGIDFALLLLIPAFY